MTSRDRGDVRSAPPAPGSSPSGANEGLFGVLETFTRLPSFGSMLERVFGLVRQNPGDLRMSAGLEVPSGWLACDGAAYDIAAYPRLFKAIGVTWGGDGVRTFAVPDFRGRAPQGVGASPGGGISGRDLGDVGGEETVTLLTTNLPAHSHVATQASHAHSTGAGGSFLTSDGSVGVVVTGTPGAGQANAFFAQNSAVAVTSSQTPVITVQNTGSGSAFPISTPFAAVHVLIYAG